MTAASDTFLTRYRAYAETRTEAPAVYHELVAHAILGAVIGRRAYVAWADWIFPSFLVCLLGPSSYRKSTALRIGLRVLDVAAPEVMLEDGFSKEGLLDSLVENPTRILMLTELESLLGDLSRDFMRGTEALLNAAYDCEPRIRRRLTNTKTKKTKTTDDGGSLVEQGSQANVREVYRPFLSIVGAITPAGFESLATEQQFRRGFLTRFLLVQGELGAPLRPPGPDEMQELALARSLQQVHDELSGYGPNGIRLEISEDCHQMYERFMRDHRRWMATYQEPVSLIASKMEILPWKLAITSHLATPKFDSTLTLANMEAGIDLTLRLRRTLPAAFGQIGFGREARAMDKITKIIRDLGVRAAHSEVLHQSRLEARTFKSFIETLLQTQRVEIIQEERGGRQPKAPIYYRLTQVNGDA